MLLLGTWPQQAETGSLVRWGGQAWTGLAQSSPSSLLSSSSIQLGGEKFSQPPAFLGSPPARPRRWARICLSVDFHSPEHPQRVKPASRPRLSPRSSLLYRLAEGGALRGVHGRDWGAGVEEVQQILSGFLLINWAVFTPGTFLDSQKVSLCVQLWGEKKHSTWLHQIMDLISETPFLVTN